jgi:hypothetical protein
MKTIRNMLQRTTQTPAFAFLVFTFAIAGWHCQSKAQEVTPASHIVSDMATSEAPERTAASEVVWQHVGRLYLNPNTGKAVYAGYLVHINGITSSLFNGSPSETTAFFTFSTDVLSLTPLPKNGDIALSLISAGTFSVYHNTSPNGDWSNPGTFSSGQLIATFARKESLFPQIGPIGFHSLSESLVSSQSFRFDGQTFDFDRIAPHGITFAQYFSATPLDVDRIKDYQVAFAAAGSTLAIGGSPRSRF